MVWPISIVAALTVSFLVGLAVHRTRFVRARSISNFARRVAFPFTASIEDRLDRRLSRRLRFSLIGALIGIALFSALALLSPAVFELAFGGQVMFVFYFAACAIGLSVASLTSFGTVPDGQRRVARINASRLVDYIAPGWIVAAVALSAAGIAGTVVLLRLTDASETRPVFALLAVVMSSFALVVLAVAIVLTRRLLATPQPAADTNDLAWDDALRALALRDIWSAPLTVGIVALLCALALVGGEIAASIPAAFVPLFVALTAASGPGTRFQKRLWPNTPLLEEPPLDPSIEEMLHS
jgi:hypothetical protein